MLNGFNVPYILVEAEPFWLLYIELYIHLILPMYQSAFEKLVKLDPKA